MADSKMIDKKRRCNWCLKKYKKDDLRTLNGKHICHSCYIQLDDDITVVIGPPLGLSNTA